MLRVYLRPYFPAEKIPLQILEFKRTVHDMHYSSSLDDLAILAKI
jgi:hypothetical protein